MLIKTQPIRILNRWSTSIRALSRGSLNPSDIVNYMCTWMLTSIRNIRRSFSLEKYIVPYMDLLKIFHSCRWPLLIVIQESRDSSCWTTEYVEFCLPVSRLRAGFCLKERWQTEPDIRILFNMLQSETGIGVLENVLKRNESLSICWNRLYNWSANLLIRKHDVCGRIHLRLTLVTLYHLLMESGERAV